MCLSGRAGSTGSKMQPAQRACQTQWDTGHWITSVGTMDGQQELSIPAGSQQPTVTAVRPTWHPHFAGLPPSPLTRIRTLP